ncbi:MAG: SDR family oxidoreductase [Gammaproteobacteria bacterium]
MRKEIIPVWISLIPVHVLPDYLPLLEDFGIRRIVVLSTTSRFTKIKSADKSERELAARIQEAEDRLAQWASSHRVEWTILQPTLIYDLGKDRNVTEIAGFIRRFGFFPVLGAAKGMRQPIAAVDVAKSCLQVLESPKTVDRCYVIAGRETMTYREMVHRVFEAMGKKPRILAIPLALFRIGIGMVRLIPRFSNWNTAMAERMNHDLTFDCVQAVKDFGFAPCRFLEDPGTEKKTMRTSGESLRQQTDCKKN